MSQLRVTSPKLSGAVFVLDGEYFTIGREPGNNIHLDHTSVSKQHAMLKVDNGDFKLFDLHSTNGVIVNGDRRVVAHLREGDKILLGEVELRFEANNKLAATPALPPLSPMPSARLAPTPLPKVEAPKAEPKPAPAPPSAKPKSLLSVFRRTKPTEKAPAPATQEVIHTELIQTFSKMGLEMPKPPPAKPTSKPPTSLPPLPTEPKPNADRLK